MPAYILDTITCNVYGYVNVMTLLVKTLVVVEFLLFSAEPFLLYIPLSAGSSYFIWFEFLCES